MGEKENILQLRQEAAKWKNRALEAAEKACEKCFDNREGQRICEKCRIKRIKEEAGE